MGTEKRERQKANRQQRLMEEAKAERAGAVKRNAVRWGAALVAAIGAVVLIAWVGGAFDGDGESNEAAVRSRLPPLDTTPLDTTPVETLAEARGRDPRHTPDRPRRHRAAARQRARRPKSATPCSSTTSACASEDGTEFDNSYDRGQPFPVVLGTGSVIPGWDEGLVGAQAGARIQLDIPAELAYGDSRQRRDHPAG